MAEIDTTRWPGYSLCEPWLVASFSCLAVEGEHFVPANLILIGVVLFLMPSAAKAEFSLEQYRSLIQSAEVKDKLSDYVTGVGRGIFWANVMLGADNKERLFCLPAKLALDAGIIQSVLAQELRMSSPDATYEDDTPIELILTKAFMRRFPCDR
ncbi:MAG: hypothetical protein H8K10_03960 [Nitrospira sp.]|nr:hypothetical protein [Nitrospira sp.]HRB17240.1 hypothetical protein [Nitrospira sp.]